MKSTNSKNNSQENLQTLINKCWDDENFKKELIADPVKAIEELSGKPLDLKGKKIVVNDQSDISTVYINIPANPSEMELTDVELEAVAGGAFSLELTWTGICISWD